MFGRRGYQRFDLRADGVMHVLSHVVIQQLEATRCVAMSRQPGVVGEVLRFETFPSDARSTTKVRVTESQPVVVNGSARHRMRLQTLGGGEDE